MPSRPATRDDVDHVTETLTLAFLRDPVWSVALARPDGSTTHHAAFWRLYVEGSLRYSTVFMTDDGSAVSVWIPPGGTDLSDIQEAVLEQLVTTSLKPAAARAMSELWERFESNHPRDEPHAYLSLLATHPDHRGQGIGQRLLAEDLARFDRDDVPSYLESTNPGNDHRYQRAGFQQIGGFQAVLNDAPISTMWRPSRGSAAIVEIADPSLARLAEERYLDGRAALFPDTAQDEADRLRSSMELAVMADAIAGLDGLDPAKPTEPKEITARAEVLVADLVEPARATTLDQLDEGRQGLEIATAWLRSKNALSAVGVDAPAEPEPETEHVG